MRYEHVQQRFLHVQQIPNNKIRHMNPLIKQMGTLLIYVYIYIYQHMNKNKQHTHI